MLTDAYDPRRVFDDVVGREVFGPASEDAAERVRLRARCRRLPRRARVVVLGYDLTPWTFAASPQTVLGSDGGGLQMFQTLERGFRRLMPPPRAVRVDGEEGYREFREARREPYVAALAERLDALEARVAAHLADEHGGGRVARLEEALARHLAERVDGDGAEALRDCLRVGGSRVPLDVPTRWRRRAAAWQDGPEVLVTICVDSPRGEKLFATSGAPLADHFDEVAAAATDEGIPLALVVDVPQSIAAESILAGLASAAGDLAGCGEAFVGALSFGDPVKAAAMSLIQHCQRGSRRARQELAALWHGGGEGMLREAGEILLREQRGRAR